MKKRLILALIFTLAAILYSKPALASTLYLSPGSGDVSQGGVKTVQVRLNGGGDTVNAVSAFLSYPQDKLEVAWINYTGSAFSIQAEDVYGGGVIKISRGSFSPVSGNISVASIGFRGKGLGSATVAFIGGSAAPRASDSSDSLNLGASAGGTYKIVPAAAKTPAPSVPEEVSLAALEISDIKVSEISTNSATISWKTNIEADSFLEYGLAKDQYILNASSGESTKDHSLKIEGPLLLPGSTFHFRVKSKDAKDRLVSGEDMTFQLTGYEVRIQVTDEKGLPVAGVEVLLYSEPQKGVTDKNGEVVFGNVSPGKHLAVVRVGSLEKSIELDVKGTAASEEVFTIKMETALKKARGVDWGFGQYLTLGLLVVGFLGIASILVFWWLKSRKPDTSGPGSTPLPPAPPQNSGIITG